MMKSRFLIGIFGLNIFIISYLFIFHTRNDYFGIITNESNTGSTFNHDIPMVLYSDAFIDNRYGNKTYLRVFAMSACIPNDYSLKATIIFSNNTNSNVIYNLLPNTTEQSCPWSWAKTCTYNSYIFSSILESELISDIKKIKISVNSNKDRILNVRQVIRNKSRGLTICVQPVYWYTSFQNLFLFFETWRSQGATKFIVYFHSATFDVKKVLDYYKAMGILRIIPWPSFGRLPKQYYNKYPEFDDSTYRIGHTLALNLCVLEMDTQLGAVVDFDETMSTRNSSQTILEHAESILKDNAIGALEFKHQLVMFEPRISNLDYSGTIDPVFVNRKGPPKVIFNTSLVDFLLTHSVRSFISPATTKTSDGALLHYRHNSHQEKNAKYLYGLDLRFFNKEEAAHLRNIYRNIKNVFNGSLPIYNPIPLHILTQCIDNLRKTKECRSTVTKCRDSMMKTADWIFDNSENVFIA